MSTKTFKVDFINFSAENRAMLSPVKLEPQYIV